MLYIIDTADLEAIERAYNLYPMAGVTTNPTIISKEKTNLIELLKNIRRIIGTESMLHVQAVSLTAEKMVEERKIRIDRAKVLLDQIGTK